MRRSSALATAGAFVAASCAATPPPSQSGQIVEPETQTCASRLSGEFVETEIEVEAEEGRLVPLTVFAPSEPGAYPLIAFSHGAFASPTRYRAMLGPLAGAGFVIVAPMHIDSEEFPGGQSSDQEATWRTRNLDTALALNPPGLVSETLSARGVTVERDKLVAAGHSYGALIAHLPGGAIAMEPDGGAVLRTNPEVDAVVGWSPPGPMPGLMTEEGWSTLTAPTLTITGTSDILPGFIDDWRAHTAAYELAPVGGRALWVGEDIDHYFGGMFGREKRADDNSQALFARALETSVNFIDRRTGRDYPCVLGPIITGEIYAEDGQ